MIKKIFLTAAVFGLLANASIADSTNIGVKASFGNFNATGSETQATLTNAQRAGKSGDANFPFGSIFIEREINFTSAGVTLGLDYIPVSAEVETIKGTTTTNAKVQVNNVWTLYVQPTKKLNDGLSIFAKIGYTSGDLEVKDVRQVSGASYNTANTTLSASKTLEGPVVGLGLNKDFSNSLFVRFEVTYTDFDEVTARNSNSTLLKANTELYSAALSFGKKF
jgi:opacity protein-like surface antigen